MTIKKTVKKAAKKDTKKTGEKKESAVIEKSVPKKTGVNVKKSKKYDIDGKFIHIKVGDQLNPANNEDITLISNMVDEIIKSKGIDCILFVTHHAVDIDVVG